MFLVSFVWTTSQINVWTETWLHKFFIAKLISQTDEFSLKRLADHQLSTPVVLVESFLYKSQKSPKRLPGYKDFQKKMTSS